MPFVRINHAARTTSKYVTKKFAWFTLVELIVVVTILAILATFGFLTLSGYSQDAKDASAKANVRSIYTAISSEAAITNNSPRYYIVHDVTAALTWAATAYVDGLPLALTGGNWNASGTNYSAGNPNWPLLKLNPDKFKLSSLPAWFEKAFATYDPKSISVGAVDAALTPTASGRNRSMSYFQVVGILQSTGLAVVAWNFPTPTSAQVALGGVSGLVKNPSSSSNTGALTDGWASATSGGSQTAMASRYPGCDTDDIYLTGSNQYWAACNVGATTAYSNQSVTFADTTAAGGPTAAQKAYMGAYYQWGRNLDVTTGASVNGPFVPATAASETRFITSGTSPLDWISPQNDDLWGGMGSTTAAGTYPSLGSPTAMQGPCGVGYHVPTVKEWCDAIIAVSPTQNGGAAMVCDSAWHVEATANKFITTLKLPIAGLRSYSNATFSNQGVYGPYWASSTTGTYGHAISLSSSLGVLPANSNYRTFGFPVRCLKN